jgi:hypothetical protein
MSGAMSDVVSDTSHGLSAVDRTRFLEQGWIVVPDAVPVALCQRVVAAMCEFIGVDANDPSSFGRYLAQGHGIVPLHHHQALWDVRQWPKLHATFAFLYGTDALWVSQDRVSFKVPAHVHPDGFRMDAVHWDGDPRALATSTRGNPGEAPGGRALAVQGLVYLTDTPAEKGAFAMVPSLYRTLDEWLATPRTEAELRRPDVSAHSLVPVPGAAGSLVVWNRLMPHTSLANETGEPRLVQYVTMTPARADATAEREANIRGCLEKRPPAWAIRQRVPGQLDPEPGPPVELTALGRRLVGLD